jgi:hypothetical protein
MRAKALSTLFKENKMGVPLKIFGKGTEILTKLADKPNIEIEEGFIEGDSQEYFDFLNKHLGYIFIGKGHSESRYIGKTVYDAVVARTPIAVYRKCDTKQITFSNREYYFENETELAAIVEKLKDLEIRERWVADQHTEIMRKLPPSTFKFANFCERVPRKKLSESDIYTPPALPEKPVKITKVVKSVTEKPKTIALF